jgi:hypothetical protein
MEHVEIVDEDGNAIDRADLQPEPADADDGGDAAGEDAETETVEDAE